MEKNGKIQGTITDLLCNFSQKIVKISREKKEYKMTVLRETLYISRRNIPIFQIIRVIFQSFQ